ncbi:MAG: SEC-C domain-containing protein [Egibacteraceae bacterium]
MPAPPDLTPLQAAARALLCRHGAMDLAALAARLLAEGFDLGEDAEAFLDDELLECADHDELPDGRQVSLTATLEGAVATSRLTDQEIATGVVQVEPELGLLLVSDAEAFPLPDGRTAEIALSGARDPEADLGVWQLSGPPGWLDHLHAGEPAAFRLSGGVLHVQAAGTLADPAAAIQALAEAFAEQSTDGDPIETRQLLLAVLVDRPHVLAEPLPPLTDLLDAAELETYGDWVGEPGTAWGHADDEAGPYGLDAEGHEALGLALAGFQKTLEQGPEELAAFPEVVEALAACLSVDGVAEAFLDGVLAEADETRAAATAGWAGLLGQGAPSWPGPHLVLAGCAERAGDVESGQRALAAALHADAASPAALLDAAWYAEDRGDAPGALSLLRRAGVEADDPQVERLEHYAAPGPAAAGRNGPCPCGSGRKYKVCCAARNGHTLDARVPWLLAKAAQYVQRPPSRHLLAVVALARVGGDPDDPAWVDVAFGDPLVTELALFEEEALEDFCDERGPLLPADELALARSWVGVRPSVYEVTAVTAGDGALALRDLATGERVQVTDRAGADALETGTLLFARLLPAGEQCVIAPGVLQIPFTLRDLLLALLDTDPDGVAIAAWLAAVDAPPELRTTDGDPLVDCVAWFRVADPQAAGAALDETLEPHDGHWADLAEGDDGQVLRGTAALDGDVLEVRTHAESRLEALVATITAAVGDLELLDEQRVPTSERFAAGASAPPPEVAPAGDAGMAEALDTFMQQAEQRWVDESVPALGGVTPRQAADDPTRRGDLERLLDEFEEAAATTPVGMGTFDVGRLRRLLGLS